MNSERDMPEEKQYAYRDWDDLPPTDREPSNPAPQPNEDYLKILSICHYILGIVMLCFSSFSLLYIFVGAMMMKQAKSDEERMIGIIFIIISACVALVSYTIDILMIAAGYYLSRRKKHKFCLIVSCMELIIVPFGTVLGVFTLIVLLKPEIKAGVKKPDGPSPGSGTWTRQI
jgi:hypothetical protein